MDVALVMFKADGSRRDFAVTKPRIVVGRTSNCDLRIPLSSVSRQHCEIVIDGDRIHLRDLGSSNGTFHNDTRVQEAELNPGDRITIGPVIFTVRVNGQPEVIEPVHSNIKGQEEAITPSDVPPADADEEDTVDYNDPIAALEALAGDETRFPDAHDQ